MGQLGDLSPQASIAVGILVGLLSTSIQSLGLTLQRKSHLLEDEKDEYDFRRPPYKRRRWQLGMGMFIISNLVGSTIQITTLPLPVLSTLQASGLVFNTAFATLLLKEPFTRFSFIGTILTCTGAGLIAAFGAIGETAHSLPQLLDLLIRKQFVIWMVGTFIIVIGTLILTRFLKYWSSRVPGSHSHPKRERSPSTSRSKSRQHSLSITLPLSPAIQLRHSRLKLLRGLAFALISGILSAHSLLIAKSAVELLVRTIIDHVNQFNSYQSWLILLALVFFALTQLYYLHQGLRLCSTSVLYPFVFCVYNIIAILDGLIYFHQTSRLSTLHACLIALGTLILLMGVLALSWRLDDTPLPEPQPTPLGPGLGLVSSASEDPLESPRSPLLPITRPRSSTSKRSRTTPINESTPLLYNREGGRRPTFMIYPPPPETGDAQDIWAELDDSNDSDRDFLASLPRSVSPYLSASALKSRRRSRGDSVSTLDRPAPDSLWGRPDSGTTGAARGDDLESPKVRHKPPRRSQTLRERAHGEKRRSSAPLTGDLPGSRSRSLSSKSSKRSPGEKRKSKSPLVSPAISSDGDLMGPGKARTSSPGLRHGYKDRVRGRPRSATEAPRAVPSRWDMGVSGSVARWWQGQGQTHSQNRAEGGDRNRDGGDRREDGG